MIDVKKRNVDRVAGVRKNCGRVCVGEQKVVSPEEWWVDLKYEAISPEQLLPKGVEICCTGPHRLESEELPKLFQHPIVLTQVLCRDRKTSLNKMSRILQLIIPNYHLRRPKIKGIRIIRRRQKTSPYTPIPASPLSGNWTKKWRKSDSGGYSSDSLPLGSSSSSSSPSDNKGNDWYNYPKTLWGASNIMRKW